MTDNALRTHYPITVNQFASNKANDALDLAGKTLPCRVTAVSGQLVTIAFEINSGPYTLPTPTVPMALPSYFWSPVQVGDKGLAVPADVLLAPIAGISTGTADLSQRGNLSTLLFIPVSNKAWSPPSGDPNKATVQGPNGATVQTADGKTTITVDGTTGNVTVAVAGGKTVTVSSGGTAQPVKLADGSNSLVLMAQ